MSATPRTAKSPGETAPLSGRAAAADAVEAALTGRGFAMDVLRSARNAGRLSPREAGLATEIALGTLRHLHTSRHVLGRVGRFESRRTPPRMQAILYGAAYQMIWMDRIPVFAAASEAVSLARARVSAAAARMVNALVRRLSAAIAARRTAWDESDPRLLRVNWSEACALDCSLSPIPSASNTDVLTIRVGETHDRFRTLTRRLGAAQAAQVAWASQAVPPIVLQRNRLRADPAAFRAAAAAAGSHDSDCGDDTAFVAADQFCGDTQLIADGSAFVQDSTAAAAARMVAARPGERVLDLCAAPGGKSIAMALDMRNCGEVVAADIDTTRLARVAQNAERLGLSCIRTCDANAVPPGAFDAVLLDVPCSNSGVIARRPEARFGLTARKLAALVALQERLLRAGADAVRPGGRLVYSTCSIEPKENEDAVRRFASQVAGWRVIDSQLTLPHWGARPSDWRDGGFAARMERERVSV